MRHVDNALIDDLLDVLQPAKMRYGLGQLWKELETIGHRFPPFFIGRGRKHPVEGRIQLDAVKLRRVIRQLVLGSFRVKILEVRLVPLRTAYPDL